MRLGIPLSSALVVALALAGCGSTESTLTRMDVEKKLTANPAPEGTKRLTKASCADEGGNKYTCGVTTEDGDDLSLDVQADGEDVRVVGGSTD